MEMSHPLLTLLYKEQCTNQITPGHCHPMKPPSIGTLTLAAGNGTNVGTVMTLWCPLLHRASSGGLIKCEQDSNGTHWTGGIPECKKIEHQDFHLAILLSIISTGIIIIMSIYFITSCLLNCVKKEEARQLDR
ncbi:sushi domain-containing protein 3 [Silurus asotus]|uniref:Sushi domain-containing protein 3 n=1 Tax=Silurus asotus TaxID=30991 RepID=A0AAD5FN76_SILAS|nr:sushi domain-containing protein 3 [Silurus asotus]